MKVKVDLVRRGGLVQRLFAEEHEDVIKNEEHSGEAFESAFDDRVATHKHRSQSNHQENNREQQKQILHS